MAELRERLQTALGESYHLESELGGGGMSRVFLAQEVRLGREVVVKVLPPEWAAGVSAERFEREIQLAAKLQHPHIVPLLTAGANGDLLYYIMPRVEGQSLRARLVQEHELPIGEAVRILRDVCDALAYAHGHGIVHRDVKPDNVLLSGKHALVTDFGVAKAVAQSTGSSVLTSLGVALGTPAYMAPEQAAADPGTDQRADIYAVGALAYEMVTGRPPFIGPSPSSVLAQHVSTQPDPVTKYRPSTPPALAELIHHCLEKRPADRFQSANEILEQLEPMTTPSGGSAAYSAASLAAAERSHPVRVAGLFGLAALAVLGGAYGLMHELGLPGWVMPGVVLLLVLGLPVVLFTGMAERRRALAGTSGTGGVPPAGGLHGWLTWRKAVTGGVLAFAGLGMAAGLYMAMRVLGIGPVGTLVASGVLAERDRLVLADVENRTADSTLGPSLTEALRVDLAQSRVVRLLDAAAITQALGRMGRAPATPLDLAVARELAQRENAKAVVHGQIDPVGRGYVVSAELVNAADGAVLVAVRENAKDDGAIIEAVDRLSRRLRERIGESLRSIRASEPLEEVTTGSLDALRKYSQSVKEFDAGNLERTISLLNEATALDTGFAMAYRKLAVQLSNTGGSPTAIANAATAAFRHRDRLPPLERDLTTAYYYWTADYDLDKVASAYRSALELDPENGIAWNNLALVYMRKRRWAEAESLVVRGLAVNTPGTSPLYINAVETQVAQGKFAAAAGEVDQLAARRSPTHPMVLWLRVGLAGARREFDSAEVYLRRLAQTPELGFQEGAALGLMGLDEVRGKLGVAQADQRQAFAAAERRGLPGSYLSYAVQEAFAEMRYRGAAAPAVAAVDAALKRHPLASMPALDRPYLLLAAFYAEAGQPARGRALMAEWERETPEAQRRGQSGRHGAEGLIAYAEGRFPDAITALRAWYDEDGCATCGLFELGRSYDKLGQRDSAVTVYERAVNTNGVGRLFDESTNLGPMYRRLGELYEERGQLDRARDYYSRFVDLWKNADPDLQPFVRDVRQRLVRLTAEGAR
ncbi:MAG TPA: protein kinase [Gemmatimonadales bacterium]|nr:protein kinase [Gemmatimonadales bacterium]